MNTTDLAWFAGLYEGEGWIGNPRPNSLALTIGSTDLDVLQRAQGIVGGRIHGPYINKRRPDWKPAWRLNLSARRAYAAGVAMWPWLGERRQGQITAAVSQWLSIPGWGRRAA